MAQTNPPRGGLERLQDAGAEGQDPLHAPVPADLSDRRAHHGAGDGRPALTDFFRNQQRGGGLLGLYDLFAGGQLSRATVFALGIMPYISASIFVQIAGAVVPQVEKMQKDEEGRKKINQWTRYITVVLAGGAGVGLRAVHRVAAGRGARPRDSASGCRWRSSSPRARCS